MVALCLTALIFPSLIKKTSAVESLNVGVYWDSQCTNTVESIDWGELTPGSTGEVEIFIRNEELEKPCFLYLRTEDWSPVKAKQYIGLSWDYNWKSINFHEVLPVTLKLTINEDIEQITEYGFNILILGTEYIVGDLNHDGKVDVRDVAIVALAFGSTPADPNWDPRADVDENGAIDTVDLSTVARNFGVSAQ